MPVPEGSAALEIAPTSILGIHGAADLAGERYAGGQVARRADTVGGSFDGNRAPATPEYIANLGVEWDVPQVTGLTLTARGIHFSSQYLDQANSKQIDGWERFDAGARYAFKVDGKDITLRASIENLLEDRYWASAGVR